MNKHEYRQVTKTQLYQKLRLQNQSLRVHMEGISHVIKTVWKAETPKIDLGDGDPAYLLSVLMSIRDEILTLLDKSRPVPGDEL